MGDALLNKASEHWGKDQSVMKRIAASVAGLLIAAPIAARAHLAVQPRYEAEFYAWTSCYKSFGLDHTMSCDFPMQGADHIDAITVYCKDTTLQPHWDKKWKETFGRLNLKTASDEEFRKFLESQVIIPAFTVEYYSYHIRNKKGFAFFKRGPFSPWANECRRVFPDLEE